MWTGVVEVCHLIFVPWQLTPPLLKHRGDHSDDHHQIVRLCVLESYKMLRCKPPNRNVLSDPLASHYVHPKWSFASQMRAVTIRHCCKNQLLGSYELLEITTLPLPPPLVYWLLLVQFHWHQSMIMWYYRIIQYATLHQKASTVRQNISIKEKTHTKRNEECCRTVCNVIKPLNSIPSGQSMDLVHCVERIIWWEFPVLLLSLSDLLSVQRTVGKRQDQSFIS